MSPTESITTDSAAFRLERVPLELRVRAVTVERTEWITPGYRRIHFAGEALRGFDSKGADDHIRVLFPDAATGELQLPQPGPKGLSYAPDAPRPISREYTPVAWDPEAGTLVVDFVIHSAGVATSWAAAAEPGSIAAIGGPRGSLTIVGQPEWWLLAGDQTAIPAIRRHLAAVAPGVPVRVILSVPDESAIQEFATAAELEFSWVYQDRDAPIGDTAVLERALAEVSRPEGDGFAFVAAEQSIVKPARAKIVDEWGIEPTRTVIKGYWKRGEAEYHAPH